MPIEILIMIGAFLIGIAFDYLRIGKRSLLLFGKGSKTSFERAAKLRELLYLVTVIYLLFKIGFVGGGEIIGQSWQMIVIPGIVVILAASFWTLLVLLLLNRWSSFEPVAQTSIAAHFGSVSVGTFIAAMAFLDALGVYVNPGVAIWLALMELPAVLIVMWKLGIRLNTIIPILKEEWSLAILPVSIVLGVFFGEMLPERVNSIVFGLFFMPILLYFLFEMGRRALDSIGKLRGKMGSVFFVGIAIPVLGGLFGTSLGYWLGYDTGSMFTMAILMASASYVLAPLCMQEVLKSVYHPNQKLAEEVVAISMALSVGVTLPFNVLIGFELYYVMIKGLQASSLFALFGFALPLVIGLVSFLRKPRLESS